MPGRRQGCGSGERLSVFLVLLFPSLHFLLGSRFQALCHCLEQFLSMLRCRCSCSKTNVRIQSTQARFTHQYLQATVNLTFHCGLLVLSQHDEVILATPGLKVGMRGRFLGTGCRGLRGPLLVCRVFIHRPQVFARSSTKAGAVGSL